MKLHLIGGFLGSGKTTAIASAAKQLIAQGKQVGVVTNDQGKYLVDTTFLQMMNVPTVEVTGGCFCCNYDDLDKRLDQLLAEAQPDVIFAESVGSCADIVATVARPLLQLRQTSASFSVFADSRLLLHRLKGLALPFSTEVIYIFDKQIEEAGLLVMNKIDLLDETQAQELQALARARYPDKLLRLQNSLNPDHITGWLQTLQKAPAPQAALSIDYDRYGAGEAELAWLNQELILTVPAGQARETVIDFIDRIIAALREQNAAIGHLKFMLHDGKQEAKVSFPTLETSGWQEQIPAFDADQFTVLVNARVQASAEALHNLIRWAAEQSAIAYDAIYQGDKLEVFHPAYPNPKHRMT